MTTVDKFTPQLILKYNVATLMILTPVVYSSEIDFRSNLLQKFMAFFGVRANCQTTKKSLINIFCKKDSIFSYLFSTNIKNLK